MISMHACVYGAVREEKIRKLEQQLRNAYGSMGRAALRATAGESAEGVLGGGSVRISRVGRAAAQAPVGQSLDEAVEVSHTLQCVWPLLALTTDHRVGITSNRIRSIWPLAL